MKLPLNSERLPIKKLLLYGLLPSFIKKIIYKMRGYKIGANVIFGFGSLIIADNVVLGDNVKIGLLSILKAKTIEIGSYSSIAAFCYFDTEKVIIGKDTRIREQVLCAGLKVSRVSIKNW